VWAASIWKAVVWPLAPTGTVVVVVVVVTGGRVVDVETGADVVVVVAGGPGGNPARTRMRVPPV